MLEVSYVVLAIVVVFCMLISHSLIDSESVLLERVAKVSLTIAIVSFMIMVLQLPIIFELI